MNKELKYIDIHTHVNFKAYDEDRDEVIQRALNNKTWMINVGTQVSTSLKAVELAEMHEEGVYAIVGLHPIHTGASYHDEQELGKGGQEFTSRGEVFDKEVYKKFFDSKKVVGIGECGLDFYRTESGSIEKQKEAFVAQIELANELDVPLMLHIRNNPDGSVNAYQEALKILKEHSVSKAKGNAHFFAGTLQDAQDYLDFGFYLSFTGVITFTDNYDEIIKMTPLDRIMSETDAPYVTPVPHRGNRNEPVFVKEVVKKIAKVKELEEEFVAEAILQNAKRLFLKNT